MCICGVYVCMCSSLCVVADGGFVCLSFGGSETLIKINIIIGFSLHLTNVFPPPVYSVFPIHPPPPPFFPLSLHESVFQSSACSPPPPPPPPPCPRSFPSPPLSLSLFCAIRVLRHIIFVTSHHYHANILPSTEQENNIAQPKTDKWFSFLSHFSSFFIV